MKIDINKIEGYAEMSAEDKVKALESFELADPDYSGYVKKDLYDKTASEVADWKKKYKDTLSEKEQAELDAKEKAEQIESELKQLRAEKTIAGYKAELLASGYEDALASDTAKALADGDMAKVFANQKIFKGELEKKLKKDSMEGMSKPGTGGGSKGITQEQFDAMSYTDRLELFNSDRETYNELNGGK